MNSLRGPILIPRPDRSVDFLPDGVLRWDGGLFTYVGPATEADTAVPRSVGIICPPFLDAHIHIPQWPIRGHFCDGVDGCPEGGRLLAGLNRNVFPTEAKCADVEHAKKVVKSFAADTLAHGVVGGSAYMTVHAAATAVALRMLPPAWRVGLVLMNQNCPENLRTDDANLELDVESLADEFGDRLVVTDRFAVAVDTPLRARGVKLADRLGLRMQTHLNEQVAEKQFVEKKLYPEAKSYTDVYRRDGLLDPSTILAHCIHMTDAEWDIVARSESMIAHCPTSNLLLESGVMSLDKVIERDIPYAICTDVGASPTTSILAEMAVFLAVHRGKSKHATACEALYRTTLGAAEVVGVDLGRLEAGRPASFVDVVGKAGASAEETIVEGMLRGFGRSAPEETVSRAGGLEESVLGVTVGGVEAFRRHGQRS